MVTGCLKMALKHPKTDFELVVILMAHLGCMDVAAFDTDYFLSGSWCYPGTTGHIRPLAFF